MLKKEAIALTGGLSYPEKMPGAAYGIPAKECKTGAALRKVKGSVCFRCYALKGRYAFPPVQAAQYRRLATIRGPQWADAMVKLIGKTEFFRWHDSGDIQDIEHLERIAEVCRRTPGTRHWLPTREKAIVRAYLAQHECPPNLVIRASAAMIDGDHPAGFPHTSGVHKKGAPKGAECRAYTRGGHCGKCRLCWNASVPAVSYPQH